MMREQTLITGLATRFTFIELALRRVPVFTRRSRAGTFQIISARLSKNGAPWLLLPGILLFLDTLRPREKDGSESVAAVCSGFCTDTFYLEKPVHLNLVIQNPIVVQFSR